MQLDLNRFIEIQDVVIGILTIDGRFQCFTLEDAPIPCGTYAVRLTNGGRPSILVDVPGHRAIRVREKGRRSGGSILVGRWDTRHGAEITESREAYRGLLARLMRGSEPTRLAIRSTAGGSAGEGAPAASPLARGLYDAQGLYLGAESRLGRDE